MNRPFSASCGLSLTIALLLGGALSADQPSWPPRLPGVVKNSAKLSSAEFLQTPEAVVAEGKQEGAAPFVVAKTPPTVTLYFHDQLGPDAASRRLWSSWGDIGIASDGRVYCGIGDHHFDKDGDARCFIYCYDPKQHTLTQVVDMNQVVAPKPGRPSWSKVHAKIDEGVDGKIYFSCTLNDGNRAKDPDYCHWDQDLPGGQLYQYDPKTGKTVVFLTLPAPRCTATSLYDRARNIWWCNLEAGEGNALWAVNLKTKQPIFKGTDGSVGFNRAIGLAKDGSIYFNGESDAVAKIARAQAAAAEATKANASLPPGKVAKTELRARAAKIKAELAKTTTDARETQRATLMKYDAGSGKIVATKAVFVGSPGLRCMTRQSSDGTFYGVTQVSNELFRYSTKDDRIELLGPSWLLGTYTTVIELSPDERYLYYLPGAHGGAHKNGTPVIQYEIATGTRKVLAFLGPALSSAFEYTPSGTYGAKLTPDGGTLYVNFNGDPSDRFLVDKMRQDGFGLTSFAVIQIPSAERK